MTGKRKHLFFAAILLVGCGGENDATSSVEQADAPGEQLAPQILVSNYPLYFVTKRIAGAVVPGPKIDFPDIEGDPANWIPSEEQILALQEAELVIVNGAGAEPWLSLITLNDERILDTTLPHTDQLIDLTETVLHQHGPEGEHSHAGTAFTTWLDPHLLTAQAGIIAERMAILLPQHADEFRQNLEELSEDLAILDQQLGGVFAGLAGSPVLFSHPVYQYLERRYAIDGQSLHWEPGEPPPLSEWVAMQRLLSSHPANIMLWEDHPLAETEERIAELGVSTIIFSPVANRPAEGDFISIMSGNIKRLEQYMDHAAISVSN